MSSDQNPGYSVYIGDEILSSYIGIIIGHYKDPYQPTSIMECQQGLVHVAQIVKRKDCISRGKVVIQSHEISSCYVCFREINSTSFF